MISLRKHPPSLKKRLITYLIALIVVVWLTMTFSAYHAIRDELRSFLDTQLSQIAYALLEINFENIQDYEATIPDKVADFLNAPDNLDIRYQVWKKGKLVLYSLDAPTNKLELKEGFSNFRFEDEVWRALHLIPDNKEGFEVIIIANQDIESLFITPMTHVILLHLLFQLAAVVAAIWYAVNRGLLPLNRLAGKIATKSYTDLRPISERHIPDEITPLINALNSLFQRLEKAFAEEREFTNHAAHELRTPLAALKMQVQVAMREKDHQKQQQQLQNIVLGVNRATHLIGQLLDLARLDPESGKLQMEELNLRDVIAHVVSEQRLFADQKRMKLRVSDLPDSVIVGNMNYLTVMLRNLIDNAIRYGPEGSEIAITFHADKKNKTVTVSIEDRGDTIPEDKRQKIFDRFYRIPGNKKHGIGIGLAIVRKIADIHGARVTLTAGGQNSGNVFNVIFPYNPS